jgi:hypothetical protein
MLSKIRAALEVGELGDIDHYLMRLLMGSRVDSPPLPSATNVLTFVKHMDREIPGFQQQYERLSESQSAWRSSGFISPLTRP